MNKQNTSVDNLTKLQWACRRGMLELDVLLGNFLKEAYPHLSESEKLQFIELLNYTDPELFAWLMARDQPKDQALLNIVKLIRQHARARI